MRAICNTPPWAAALVALLGGSYLVCAVNTGEFERTDPFAVRKIPADVAASVPPIVAANTSFALDLYARVRTTTSGNLFISPFSISTALNMTAAGASGRTEKEMATVLHTTAIENVHPVYGALVASLDRGADLGGYDLEVANSLWAQRDAPIRQPFVTTLRDHYSAGFDQVDFQSDAEGARNGINNWVERNTADRIHDLFPPGTITRDTRLVLANAIYFKGLWATQFKRERTRNAAFHVTADRTVEVPMMSADISLPVVFDREVSVLEMPYQGDDLSMVILLPTQADGLAALEASLTPEKLSGWIGALAGQKITVSVPRFRMTSEFDLARILAELGMPSAFNCGEADLSAMTAANDWCLAAVRHKAFVEVNEEGTEAAAATGISVGVVSLPPSFTADHPFIFLIRDKVTGSLLFLGRVVDPTA
jgi:serpin B